MTCEFCDAPVASSRPHHPEAEFLCNKHLNKLIEMRRPKCSLPDCDRPLYLAHCSVTNGERTVCAFCALGRPVSEDINTTVHPVTIKRGKIE